MTDQVREQKCARCGRLSTRPLDELDELFDPETLRDLAGESDAVMPEMMRREADQIEDGTPERMLCEGCVEELDRTHRVPPDPLLPTLAKTIVAWHAAAMGAIATKIDVRDVFPKLPLDATPAGGRMGNLESDLVAALDRIGRRVSAFDPDPDMESDPFIVVEQLESGAVGYVVGDHWLLHESGAVPGHRYAPDGSPLD